MKLGRDVKNLRFNNILEDGDVRLKIVEILNQHVRGGRTAVHTWNMQ